MRSLSRPSLSNRLGCSFMPACARDGFTLLEVCVVLFILAVLFVVAVPPAAHLMDEEKLQGPIRELQNFARTARRNAMMENRTYEVLLLNGSYVLRPVDKKKDANDTEQKYDLPDDVTFAIKRLGDREFLKQTDATWLFAPNGICEPMNFVFQRKGDWVRFQVDPLTATFQNKESSIQ
jgi:prepilin-type N-terminal cleavage/methylation domain-containing protein